MGVSGVLGKAQRFFGKLQGVLQKELVYEMVSVLEEVTEVLEEIPGILESVYSIVAMVTDSLKHLELKFREDCPELC